MICFFLSLKKYSICSLAPDYVLCSKTTENRLVSETVKACEQFYAGNLMNSESYCRIINNRHFKRVRKLINQDKIVHGGQMDFKENYIAPAIMYGKKNCFILICFEVNYTKFD